MEPVNMGLSGVAQWNFLRVLLSQAGLIYEFKGIWKAAGTARWWSICLPSIPGFRSQQHRYGHANKHRLTSLHARLLVVNLPSVAMNHSCFYYCRSLSVWQGFATWHRMTLNLGPLAPAFRVLRLERCPTTPAVTSIVNGRQSVFKEKRSEDLVHLLKITKV